ncbi:MAG: class I SAM-dependent methyltransferase [Planctomycetota bacterium]|nr:class I SAM-dependent methyltransferase [Planctomycetota bacterium]
MPDAALASPKPALLINAGGKSPAEVREMFARVARRYDFLNHLLSLGLDFTWRRRLAAELDGLGRATGSPTSAPAPATWPSPRAGAFPR